MPTLETLQQQILDLRTDVNNIQLNVGQSEKKFKRGIAVATIGYTVTIAGGLMLGRKNDELGKILLVGGGATGITGTILMVDAFKYLGRIGRNKAPSAGKAHSR
ncbi:MAG: hypothetical protein LW821_15070 [Flammeovirgaceae bacterium]|nr:hypothetical protein [Flammeovirgaceae bacterium]